MTKIHEFDPQIYPFKLWVSVNPDFKALDRKFYFLSKERDVVDVREEDLFDNYSSAKTLVVAHKVEQTSGILIIITMPKKLDVATICHEACHFADFIAETVGFPQRSFDNGEAYAYLAGWCADCIDKARKFKNKKK